MSPSTETATGIAATDLLRIDDELTDEERQSLLEIAAHYASRGAYYRKHLQQI